LSYLNLKKFLTFLNYKFLYVANSFLICTQWSHTIQKFESFWSFMILQIIFIPITRSKEEDLEK
jgi:hypothetical protein